MSRKVSIPQSRRHVQIFDEDWEFLFAEFGPGSKNNIGVGVAIRTIVHRKVQDMKAKANEAFDRIRGEMKEAGKEQFISTEADVAGEEN